MSALLNIGAGNIADRLTILALKLLHYGAAGTPTDHLRDERNALLVQLRSRKGGKDYTEELLELAAVNGRLWTLTDQLRALDNSETPRATTTLIHAGQIGIDILRLNDHRAKLVARINKATGEWRGSEKGTGKDDG